MTKKNTVFFVFIFIAFFVAFSLRAEKVDTKEERWINQIFQQATPPNQLFGTVLSSRRGPLRIGEDKELTLMAEHNINAHLMDEAILRSQGWSRQAIAAHFEQTLVHTSMATGSISGKLTEKGGGAITNFASVTAYNEFGRYCGSDYYVYLNNGRYKISNLLPGKYYVLVRSAYYEDQYYRNASDWRTAKLVRVNKYKEKRNINFKLKRTYNTEGKGAISGQVKRKEGTPLKDCIIYIFDLDDHDINHATTDANGQYIVPNIPTGEFKVVCYYQESSAYTQIWYRNAQSFEDASIVTVKEPNTTPYIDFVLEIGGIIKGKVLSPSGAPIEAYSCTVFAYDMQENVIRADSSDDQGKFTLGFLTKGRYKIHVRYYGRENCISSWYKKAKNFKSATSIQVNPSQTQNVKIKLERGGIIKGSITGSNGSPIALECEIRAYDDSGGYVKRVQADESGQFALQGLESGRYKLYAEVYDYPWEGSPQPASEWYNGKFSFQDAEFVKVTAPRTKSNVNFSLTQGGYITCIVRDPHQYPLASEASVYAYNSRGDLVSSAHYTDYYGRFAINGLPSGNYRVRAVYYGDENYLSEFYDNKLYFEVAEDITVTAPGGVENILFELDYAGVLQGFLTDAKKKRIMDEANQPVTIYAFDAETGEFSGQTQNTFMSGYHMELLEGQYKLAALSFYYNWMTSADDFGVTYHPAGKGFYDSATKIYSAKPGTAKKLSSLALKKPKGSISGTIYDENSADPMTEGIYLVWVFDSDGFLAGLSGYLDSNNPISGKYRVGGLRPGNYYLLAATANVFLSFSDISIEWYGGIQVPQEELYDYTPKMDIPAGAVPVSVGTTDTSGIDFYVNTKK